MDHRTYSLNDVEQMEALASATAHLGHMSANLKVLRCTVEALEATSKALEIAKEKLEHRASLYKEVYELLKDFDMYGTGGDASACAREVLQQLREARSALKMNGEGR